MQQSNFTIGILTSGGDAPGMNAAIRALVRLGHSRGWNVIGFISGYQGLIEDEYRLLASYDVCKLIHLGGTILKSSRSAEFKTVAGREKAKEVLKRHGVTALVVIGGDGTFRGAEELQKIWKGQIIGLPGTIDNDIVGSDFSIGYDTAVNTALEAIDKIRDTADAYERVFFVEVMGREAGFIALQAGLAGGADQILVPEIPVDIDKICKKLTEGRSNGTKNRDKHSSIVVVAEGCQTQEIAEKIKSKVHIDYRLAVLSYIQRGGSPSAADRLLATKLAAYAIELIALGHSGVMVGEIGSKLVATPFVETFSTKKPLDPFILQMLDTLNHY